MVLPLRSLGQIDNAQVLLLLACSGAVKLSNGQIKDYLRQN